MAWNRHAIAQTRLRKARRVDGVGRPKFDFHAGTDDEDWSYTTKEGDVFKCDRVAEKTKRCTIRFSEDGVRADDACKKTCGTC